MKEIKRDVYLDKLISRRENGLIKIKLKIIINIPFFMRITKKIM